MYSGRLDADSGVRAVAEAAERRGRRAGAAAIGRPRARRPGTPLHGGPRSGCAAAQGRAPCGQGRGARRPRGDHARGCCCRRSCSRWRCSSCGTTTRSTRSPLARCDWPGTPARSPCSPSRSSTGRARTSSPGSSTRPPRSSSEADEIALATGNPGFRFAGVLVGAWRGVEAEAHGADQRRPRERGRGEGAGPGRLCDRHPQQRPGPLRGGRRGRQARQRRRRLGVRQRVAAGARRGGDPRRPAGGRRRRAGPAGGADARRGHGLGARRPRALTGAAERGRGGRRPLPGGDRAARAHPHPRRARPRPPALRRVAPARGPPRGRARAAARRARDVQLAWGPRRSPSAPVAS